MDYLVQINGSIPVLSPNMDCCFPYRENMTALFNIPSKISTNFIL